MTSKLVVASSLLCLLFSGAVAFSPAVTVATQKAAASFLAARSRGLKSTKLGAARAFSEDAPAAHGRALRSRNTRTPVPVASAVVKAPRSGCQWNAAEAECELSNAVTAGYLNRLNGDYASFIAQFPACEGAETKSDCDKAGNCAWDIEAKKCFFVDFLTGQAGSPCLEAAPGTISLLTYSGTCAVIVDEAACSKETTCTWDDDEGECGPDVFLLYYGFHSDEISSETDALAEVWAMEMVTDYLFFLLPGFKWSDLLDWEGPDEACTSDASPEVCDFLREGFLPLLPNIYYCVFKYSEPYQLGDCSKDPLCTVDESDGSCGADVDYGSYMITATLDQVESEIDRELFGDTFSCGETSREECEGECYWSDADDECTVSGTALFQKIAAADTSGEDTLCRYIQAAADSDCLDIENPEKCEALDTCTWTSLTESCMPSAEYLAKGAVDDGGVDTSFLYLKEQCTKHKEKRDCVVFVV